MSFLKQLEEVVKNNDYYIMPSTTDLLFNFCKDNYVYEFNFIYAPADHPDRNNSILDVRVFNKDNFNQFSGQLTFHLVNGSIDKIAFSDGLYYNNNTAFRDSSVGVSCFDSNGKFVIRKKFKKKNLVFNDKLDYIFNSICDDFENNKAEFCYLFDYVLQERNLDLYKTFIELDDDGKKLIAETYYLEHCR